MTCVAKGAAQGDDVLVGVRRGEFSEVSVPRPRRASELRRWAMKMVVPGDLRGGEWRTRGGSDDGKGRTLGEGDYGGTR